MKRVCFFVGDITGTGGTNRVATVIASGLVERGLDVSILSVVNGQGAEFPLNPGVKLESLGMEGRSANFSDIAIWRALRRYVVENGVQILVDVDTMLSWYSIPATRGLPVKVVSWEHFHYGINVGDVGQRLRRKWGRRLAVRRAHAVVTLTERDRSQYCRHMICKRPVVAIPNPITIHPDRHASHEHRVVVAAGRMVSQKGFDLLLQAWALVAPDAHGWTLRIVGNGPMEAALRAQARLLSIDRTVVFAGKRSDMVAEFASSSIYVMSSRFEGLPLVLIEAKSCGLPIVSFDCACGPSDIVRNGLDGDLVAPGDVPGLAKALLKLIEEPARRLRYSVESLRDDRFLLGPVMDRWISLLDEDRN